MLPRNGRLPRAIPRQLVLPLLPSRTVVGAADQWIRGRDDLTDSVVGRAPRADRDGGCVRIQSRPRRRQGRVPPAGVGARGVRSARAPLRARASAIRAAAPHRPARGRLLLRRPKALLNLRTIRAIAPATPSLGDVYDRRRNNFDVLRFGLARAGILSHCYALAGRPMDPVFWLTRQIDAGSLAVEGFFVLSGFLITQSWDGDPDLRGFAVKRALRLVPALVVALVFGAFVIGPLTTPAPLAQYVTSLSTWAHFGSVALHRYLASPLLFADNPVPHQLNASLWSLRYEILCYGVVALLGSRGARWSIASALLLTAGLAGTALTTWMGAAAGIQATLARLVACFF